MSSVYYKVTLEGTITPKSLRKLLRSGKFKSCTLYEKYDLTAKNKDDAVAKAIKKCGEFALVNDEDLITEVERVYETRWDCIIKPEGVRRAA